MTVLLLQNKGRLPRRYHSFGFLWSGEMSTHELMRGTVLEQVFWINWGRF